MFGKIAVVVLGVLASVYKITLSAALGLRLTSGTSYLEVDGPNARLDFYSNGNWSLKVAGGAVGIAGTAELEWGNGGVDIQNPDTGLKRAAAGVVTATNGGGTASGYLQNGGGSKRNTADVTNATTTFSNLSDLTFTVAAGRKYCGRLVVRCSDSTAADGIKFDFAGGTATMTTFNAGVVGNVQGATAGTTVSAALATALTFTAMNGTTDHWIVIEFSFVVNAAGTVIPRFAQNAHSAGTATAALGSYLQCEDMVN